MEHDDARDGISVPQLKPDGSNWPVFKTRLTWAVDAKGLLGHFTGEDPEPRDPLAGWAAGTAPPPSAAENPDAQADAADAAATATTQAPLTAKDKRLHERYLELLSVWRRDEAKARYLLARSVPDTVLRRMKRNGDTVRDMWAWVRGEFEDKTPLVQSNVLERFHSMRCAENGNVSKFLDKLGEMVEELSTIGVDIPDKDYMAVILKSVPPAYADYLSGMINAARLFKQDVTPDEAVQFLKQDYERKNLPSSGG
ncbi:hypothetical protein OBBRIDRAFT_742973, partial [Obba rivulosa]